MVELKLDLIYNLNGLVRMVNHIVDELFKVVFVSSDHASVEV